MTEGIGDTFQKETKYYRERMQQKYLDWSIKPETYKEYSDAEKIDLYPPDITAENSLHETLQKRKSVRRFSEKSITLQQLSYLLWASTGIQRINQGYEYRTAPSAGALYPIETYIISNNVEELERGLYHYNIRIHVLETLHRGDFSEKITKAALNQSWCKKSAAIFIWTALFYRTKWKYSQRAFRYIYLDAGHIGQNLALAAVSMGLGSCQIGAFFDDDVNVIVDVDGLKESTIYMSVVGHPL